jgi:DNA-binding transcriptional LysR family regulator
MLELASSIVGSVDSIKEAFQARRRDVTRTLVVIGSPAILTEELPRAVAAFCEKHPNIKLTLIHYAGVETIDLLMDGAADMALLPVTYDLAANRRFLSSEPFADRDWVLITPVGHPLQRKRRLTPADLVRYPLILPVTRTRDDLDAFFRGAGLLSRMRISLEVSLSLAARRFVGLGLGVGIFPQPLGELKIPHVAIRSLGHMIAPERVVVLWRRGVTPKPQARLFVNFVREKLMPKPRLK